jgi:hypothetical protein
LPDTIIYLDPASPQNLQKRIRQKLMDAILSGALVRNSLLIADPMVSASGCDFNRWTQHLDSKYGEEGVAVNIQCLLDLP